MIKISIWRFLLLSSVPVFFVTLGLAPCFSQDAIQEVGEALSTGNFPWYDAENDSIQPMELPDTGESQSEDRNRINQAATATPRPGGGLARNNSMNSLGLFSWILIGIVLLAVVLGLLFAFLKMENQQQDNDRYSF